MPASFIENVNTVANATTLATGDIVEDTKIARDEAVASADSARASEDNAYYYEEFAHQWADKGHNNPVVGTISEGNAEYSSYHWSVESALNSSDYLIDDAIISPIYTWSSQKINSIEISKSDINHNHNGVYEPVIIKNNAFNKNFEGSGSATTVAKSDHTHSGVYEPVIATKNTGFNLNIGTTSGTLAEGSHTHTALYMPKVIEATAYNKPFVVDTNAPLSSEIPRGNHTHKASNILYDNTGNKIISSTTVQGALGQLDSSLSVLAVAERSKITLGMTNPTQTVDIINSGAPAKIVTAMTVAAGSKNAIYSGGDVTINYPIAPSKLIEGWFSATVTISCEANTLYSIFVMVNDTVRDNTFRAQVGSTANNAAGDFAVSIDGFMSGLSNGDRISLAAVNGTNSNDITILAQTVSWSGIPEGAIVASGTSVTHNDVTGRDQSNQHPTASIYDIGSGIALDIILGKKMDFVALPVTDNMLLMDNAGEAQDSGISKVSILNKMDKVASPTLDNIVTMDSVGNSKKGALKIDDLALKGGSTTNKFLVMNATLAGEAVSKGQMDSLVSTYATQASLTAHIGATNPHNITPAGIGAAPTVHAHAISDVTNLQTSLNAKYSKVTTPVTGNMAVFGAGDVLIDGGTPLLSANTVSKDSATGAAYIPSGTTAQRPASPANGYLRYNSDLLAMEAYVNGAWESTSADIMAIGNINSPLLDMPLNNSLVMKAGVGSATFTRASTATYVDRYGVLKTAAIDVPRFESKGYLTEGSKTNLLL
jgi:hypothetical protein